MMKGHKRKGYVGKAGISTIVVLLLIATSFSVAVPIQKNNEYRTATQTTYTSDGYDSELSNQISYQYQRDDDNSFLPHDEIQSKGDVLLPSFLQDNTTSNSAYVPDEILVKFKSGLDVSTPQKALQIVKQIRENDRSFADVLSATPLLSSDMLSKNANEKTSYGLDHWVVLTVGEHADIPTEVEKYSKNGFVECAQPNYLMTVYLTPNDPYYSSSGSWGQDYPDMWGLHHLDTSRAWDISTGSQDVTVAVVDTGVDYNHPDIHDNMWMNTDEIPGNGIDDDNDGFIDNIYGADFIGSGGCGGGCSNPDGDPMDGHGHGTHCAGIIGAVGNNNLGVVGINWNVRIMAVKGLDDTGSGTSDILAAALMWAADQGADVLSNSWGKGLRISSDPVLEDAIRFAYNQGCVVVFAAGNSHDDIQYFSPQNMDEVISVAAVDVHDEQATFTSWGDKVAVCAPGVDILSLRATGTDMYGDGTHIVGGMYYRASGTSMACPHVAGLAALLLAENPNLTSETIKTILRDTGDQVKSRRPIGLRINAADALSGVKAAIVWLDLPQWADMKGTMDIEGSACGPLFNSYTLEYGSGYTPVTWTLLTSSLTPVDDGVLASFDVTGLDEGTYTLRLQVNYGGGSTKMMTHLIIVNNEENHYIVDDDGGPGVDFTRIQDAVNVSGKDDTISVKSGVYQEHIRIDRPVQLYGEDSETTIIDGGYNGDFIVYIKSDDVTMQWFSLRNGGPDTTPSRYDSGIFVYGDTAVITGNRFTDIAVCIALSEAAETTVFNNEAHPRSGGCGMFPNVVSSSFIQGNSIYGGGVGLLLWAVYDNTIVKENVLTGEGSWGSTGIYLISGSSNNMIMNNTVTKYYYGVSFAYYSKYNLVTQNIIKENDFGITMTDSDDNTFTENTIAKNTWYGICLANLAGYFASNNNSFYHNAFLVNGINAYDPCINTWDNGYPSGGNFWSDYQGVDNFSGPGQNISGSDGIGDTRYFIPDGGNRDRYPLMTTSLFACANGPYYSEIGEPVQFSGLAFGGVSPYSWSWDFGDGNTSYEQNPVHLYSGDIATYTVTLTVTDNVGNISSDITTATIYEPLEADAHGPYQQTVNKPVQFNGSATGGVSPYTWYWEFGDGSTSEKQHPTHTYHNNGIFNVTLTVIDHVGQIDIDTTTATIGPPVLIADANGPYQGYVGEPVHFAGSASLGVPPYSWYWEFGDGNTSTLQNPIHSYLHTGVYTVALTVNDSANHTANDITTATITLRVEAGGPYNGEPGEPVQFTGSVQGGIGPFSWYWAFGDGNISNEQNPIHTYTYVSVYNVTLMVADSIGNIGTDFAMVYIRYPIVYVDDDYTPSTPGWGEDHFKQIQDGINAVAYHGTVIVYNGIYYEHLVITKPLNLIGENRFLTVIDGAPPQNKDVVRIAANGVNISGFTIQHCIHFHWQTIPPHSAVTIAGEDTTITQNRITDNEYGIVIFSSNNIIEENDITNNSCIGVYILGPTIVPPPPPPENNDISHNSFVNNNYGFEQTDACYTIVTDNTFQDCGITFAGYDLSTWNTHTIENNTANGKPIRYYKNSGNAVVPDDTAQVILAKCGNMTIQNLDISHIKTGIQIGFSSEITIKNTRVNNSDGIDLLCTSHSTMTDNTVTNNTDGFSLLDCSNITITKNLIVDNNNGIHLSLSPHNLISGNTISGNSDGILLESSNENTFTENTIQNNDDIGVFVSMEDSTGNRLYHNNFLNNIQGNAYDTGINIWDNGYPSGGNYWDDYTGTDDNGDGIGDTPYGLSDGNNQDNFPLMHRYVRGDMNVDGVVNFGDINPFVQALSNPTLYQTSYQILPSLHGDISQDGSLDFGDINPFVALLTTGHYP